MTYEKPELLLVDSVPALVLGGELGRGDSYPFEEIQDPPEGIAPGLD